MKSLSLLVITLLTCTTQIFCAATSSSCDDDLVTRTMMSSVAADGFAIATYHEYEPADPSWYHYGPATGNQFGAALIPASPMTAATIHMSKDLFARRGTSSPYFNVDDTCSLDFSTDLFAMSLCTYVHDPIYGKRYLLLCPYTPQAETVKKMVEGDSDEPSQLTDMFTVVQNLLPTTTFVLFDAGTYCEQRSMQPVPALAREIRAMRQYWQAVSRNQRLTQRERAKSADIARSALRGGLTGRRENSKHMRTGSLDSIELQRKQ